jgi:carboxylesterase type B
MQTTDVRPNIISKQFANIPPIIRSNVDEARVFAAIADLDNDKKTAEQFVSPMVPNMPLVQQAVIAAYSSLLNDVFLLASAILTKVLFTCTAWTLSSFAAQHGYKGWGFYYNAFFPNTDYFPRASAYHSSEIPLVFGTYPLTNQYSVATGQQKQLSRYMRKTWADFVKNPDQGPG